MDRYFTKKSILKQIVTWVEHYIEPDDTLIDFSCGNNDFARLLGIQSISYDLIPTEGAHKRDWLSVSPSEIDASRLVIGLNPPFGFQGKVAKQFIHHALLFEPRYLFLILPNINLIPQNQKILFEKILPSDAFYEPEKSDKRFRYQFSD